MVQTADDVTVKPAELTGVRRYVIGIGIALAYFAAAEIGFRMSFVAEQVTTVWAPTGIAIAALLIGGIRLWPAIWLGAFLANASTTAPIWTAVIVATGNTLEAGAATWALRSHGRFDDGLRRVYDVLAFVFVASIAATTISATVGVATLCAAGVQPWDRFSALWFDWWLGDALGAIIVAPAVLTTVRNQTWSRRTLTDALVYVVGAVVVTHIVFGQFAGLSAHPLEYVVFPIVIAAAVSGGPFVTTLVVLSAAVVTIWDTVRGGGPFAGPELHRSLILVQVFMGVLAGTALLLAAAIAERRTAERRYREAFDALQHREQALRDSRDVLALAMRAGSMGAWSRNLTTNEVWWSHELEQMVGMEPGAFNRTEAGFFELVHEEDRAGVRRAIDAAIETATDYIIEFRYRHANGDWRWMEGRGRAIHDASGTPRTLYGIAIDVTARKHAEMALQQAKTVAEAANQLKDQFLATLSHELRTPLNAILGYARLLQTNAIPQEKRQRAIEVIERNAVAQNNLVDDLLDMSRITTGKVRLDPKPVPIIDVVREAVDGIKPAVDAKAIDVVIDCDPEAGLVAADAARLQQVFWNLLTNAVKFTGQRGSIRVTVRRIDEQTEVAITDTGVGISPDFLPFLFEPFRQADTQHDRRHGGLGLGLAISKQLVELHGGTIQASSPGLDQGSTFIVRLPRVIAVEIFAADPDVTPRAGLRPD